MKIVYKIVVYQFKIIQIDQSAKVIQINIVSKKGVIIIKIINGTSITFIVM